MRLVERHLNTFTCEASRPLVAGEVLSVAVVDGPDYLPDWLDYHRRIGVDHYYLYDNSLGGPTGAPGSLAAAGVAARPDTDVLVWPWRKSQAQAFSHALLLGRRRCEWLLFADVDEFVYVPADAAAGPTPGALRRLLVAAAAGGAAQVSLSRLEMGPGGAVRRRLATPLAETNTRRRGGGGLWNNYKSAVRPAAARPSSRVHFAELAAAPPLGGGDDYSRVWPALTHLRAWAFYGRWDGRGYVVHYRAKSWEDFLDKWANHDQNGMVPNPAGGFRRHRFSVAAPPAFWGQYGGTRRDVAFRDYKRVVRRQARRSAGDERVGHVRGRAVGEELVSCSGGRAVGRPYERQEEPQQYGHGCAHTRVVQGTHPRRPPA
ncbi:hypothetical protein I4F81_002478 [Pyropia yezoensis]|uniref:Uncharacterized protein n=1 Tax=Pyropia yezoensis TaxID=2788 RepID=A0ACC3BQ68_PYRYE|nr:hypothetical protein I4F81_002478 [Neopyropia yezoensis]